VAVARNAMKKLEARAASGRGECLIVFADEGFLVQLVIVGVQPKLRDLIRRTATSVRIIGRRDRSVGIPAAGEITADLSSMLDRRV
jgi:hypothetical protein